jgi:hypothetical protein
MYDGVYDKLVEAGVTEVLDNELWLDIHGNIFENEAEAYGQKMKYLLRHPEKLLFVDEMGHNISQKGDGNAGGQNFMVAKDMRAQVQNSFKDNHSTVLGFTSADRRAVACVIIISTTKPRDTDVTGFNPLSKDGEDAKYEDMQGLEKEIEELNDEHSNEIDRMFPFGPTCILNGSEVPSFVTCSKNGSIESQLLINMLQRMDDLKLFNRSNGINPFLLYNRYRSRFEEPFLEYTLESGRPCTWCIGVPHGTSVWQVGDGVEQNGTFKIESKKAKSDTVTSKILSGLPDTLERSDIVRIVNIAWQKSFARVETNKRAIAARGWGSLNYSMFDHPELQETMDRVRSINEIYEKQIREGVDITDLATFNTEQGSMGLCVDIFLDQKIQEQALGKMSVAEKKEK